MITYDDYEAATEQRDLATDLLRELVRTTSFARSIDFDRIEDGANYAVAKRAAGLFLANLAQRRDEVRCETCGQPKGDGHTTRTCADGAER